MKLRQKLILYELINQGVDINFFTESFNVSSRTIRLDIDEINEFLKVNECSSSISIKSNYISLTNKLNACNIKELIALGDYYLYTLNADERQALIMIDLLFSEDVNTIDELANKFKVSRSTVQKDLKNVSAKFAENDIELLTKKGFGVYLKCSEYLKRTMIRRVVSENLVERFDIDDKIPTVIAKIFEDINIETIKTIISKAEEKFNYRLTDISFEGLLFHIALSLQRNQKGENYIEFKDESVGSIPTSRKEFDIAKYIWDRINYTFDIELPHQEIDYLAYHIFDKQVMSKETENTEEWLNIQILASNLIKCIQNELQIELRNDRKLYDGLFIHLSSAISRIKEKKILKNPLKDELLRNYQQLYVVLKESISNIENYAKNKLNDDELTYLLLHFAAAIERKVNIKESKPKVLIVCSTGLATAQLMIERIDKIFDFNIVGVVSVHHIESVRKKNKIDCVISSVKTNVDLPVLIVSPLIRDDDIESIYRFIISLGFDPVKKNQGEIINYEKLMGIIESHSTVHNYDSLLSEIKLFIDGDDCNRRLIFDESESKMLSDLLKKEHIQLNLNVSDWEEAVRKAGEILLSNKKIKKDYIDDSIKNIKELGPYVVITKGVAIPHATSNSGVIDTAISMISLENGVEFGNEQNDPVKYIFMLSTKDSKSHLSALTDLVDILGMESFYETIDASNNPEDIYEYIRNFEMKKGG